MEVVTEPGDFYRDPTPLARGIETPAGFPNLVGALREEFNEDELGLILSWNWLRVFDACW